MAKRRLPGSFKKRGNIFYYVLRRSGREFVRSTEKGTLREAESLREELYKAGVAFFDTASVSTAEKVLRTYGEATRAFWQTVGQYHDGGGPDKMTTGSSNTLWSLTWLEERIGTDTLLEKIDAGTAQELKAKRRAEPSRNSKRDAEPEPVANATVNRSVIQPLRKVLFYARDFGRATIQSIPWKDLLMDEPEERVRELEVWEEEKLFAELRDDYHDLIDVAIILGLRQGEAILKLRWHHIGWGSMTITIPGKGNRTDVMQLPTAARDILWRRKAAVRPTSEDDLVFSYVAQRNQSGEAVSGKRTIKGERIKGVRYPITKSGLRREFVRAMDAAGIVNFRYHDLRHTFATRMLRYGADLKQVQKQARHRNIETTLKYAHVTEHEMRAAMERAAQASPRRGGTAGVQDAANAGSGYSSGYNGPGEAKKAL